MNEQNDIVMGRGEKLVYVGIDCILGWFSCLILYVWFGVNALYSLSVFGVAVFILGFLKVFGENNSHKKQLRENDTRGDVEPKTVNRRKKPWRLF